MKSTKKAAETKKTILMHILTDILAADLSDEDCVDVITGLASYMCDSALEAIAASKAGINIKTLLKPELECLQSYIPEVCKEQGKNEPEDSHEEETEDTEVEDGSGFLGDIASMLAGAILSSALMDVLKEAKRREDPDSSDKD